MKKQKFETVEKLVQARKGYKFLNKNRTSPYQNYQYVFKKGKVFRCPHLNTNTHEKCGEGWNLATIPWILNNTNVFNKILVEFSIPEKAQIIVPIESDGKFRTDIIRYEKIHSVGDLVPALKGILGRLEDYKPINPIIATKLPPQNKLKKILDQVWAQVWAQVWDQVWAQVGAQVRDQVGAQVGAQVWDQVWDQVGDQVWDQVRAQVRDQVCDQVQDQVWDQVWDQVRITAYYAMKLFLGLDYENPAFDLLRLGVIVINIENKFKVFGKNGKYLGEIDA